MLVPQLVEDVLAAHRNQASVTSLVVQALEHPPLRATRRRRHGGLATHIGTVAVKIRNVVRDGKVGEAISWRGGLVGSGAD